MKNIAIKTLTIMSEGHKTRVKMYPIYANRGVLPTTKTEYQVVDFNYMKTLTRFDAIIAGNDNPEFIGLRLYIDLGDGTRLSLRIKTLGKDGIFALAARGTGLTIPTQPFNGKEVKDYRVLFDNEEFMNNLMSRLEDIQSHIDDGTLSVIVSKDVDSTNWSIPKGAWLTEPFIPDPKKI